MKYKMRAECLSDVAKFLEKGKCMGWIMENKYIPDVEIEFNSPESLDEIKKILKSIPGGHVMLETVAPVKDYTGKT